MVIMIFGMILYGKITYISRTTPPDCEVKQDVDVSTLKNQIMNILYETSQEINQDVATRQTITVKCGAESAFITEEDMERRKKEYSSIFLKKELVVLCMVVVQM